MDSPPLFRRAWRACALLALIALVVGALQTSRDPKILGRWSPAYAALLGGLLILTALLAIGSLTAVNGRLWRKRAVWLTLLGSTAVALAIAEVGLRTADPLGLAYHEEIGRYITLRQEDELLVYAQPRDQTVELDGVEVRFNSLGLRGPEVALKAADELRLLVLGDSVAFGWGVEEQATLGARLAVHLEETLGRPVTAINTGVCSYNSTQQRTYFEHRGLELDPDLVLLVMVDNDVVSYVDQWTKAEANKRPGWKKQLQNLLEGSALACTVQHVVAHGSSGIELEGVERAVGPDDAGWQDNMAALTELGQLCATRELPFAVLHFRWRSDPWSDQLLEAARTALAPLPVLDAAPWWDGYDLRQLVNSVTDSHPNANAHELTARQLARHLTETGPLARPR